LLPFAIIIQMSQCRQNNINVQIITCRMNVQKNETYVTYHFAMISDCWDSRYGLAASLSQHTHAIYSTINTCEGTIYQQTHYIPPVSNFNTLHT